jgi:hypothetical protein
MRLVLDPEGFRGSFVDDLLRPCIRCGENVDTVLGSLVARTRVLKDGSLL